MLALGLLCLRHHLMAGPLEIPIDKLWATKHIVDSMSPAHGLLLSLKEPASPGSFIVQGHRAQRMARVDLPCG